MHVAMLIVAPACFAMSLGPVEGAPLIGRPLDVSVRVQLDPGADTASLCARAEVTQGDSLTSGVTARLEVLSAQQAVIRVRSVRPVEEPIVTIVAQVGCTMPTTRRFVMLADLPADSQPAIRLPGTPALAIPRPPSSQALARDPSTSPVTRPARSFARDTARQTVRESAPTAVGTPAEAPSARVPAQTPASTRSPGSRRQSVVMRPQQGPAGTVASSRLKLDPIDLAIELDPTLKLTHAIERLIEVSPAQRAEASAALRAMTMPPAEFQQLLTMDTQLSSLRQQVDSGKAQIAALELQLQKAERDRSRTVWGFSALSLALLAGLVAALLWRRRQAQREHDPSWWRDIKVLPQDGPVVLDNDRAMQQTQRVSPQEPREPSLDLDLSNFDQLSTTIPGPAGPAGPAGHSAPGDLAPFAHLDFQASQGGSAGHWRSMKSEELSDIQEQAEFFVSLGDYDRAVNVLMAHVQASPQTSAIAWMALLELHHRLQRIQGYDGLREQIQRRLNVIVPAFDEYGNESADLESYGDAMIRITALWPSRRVLDVIEEYIYLMPGANGAQRFEMAAFNDLLVLHDLAKSVVDDSALDEIDLDGPSSQSDEFPMTNAGSASAELQGPSEEDFKLFATLLAGGRVDVNLEEAPSTATNGSNPSAAANLIDFDEFDAATARVAPPRLKYPPR